jgi:heme/copper-type cytochrome/quinol oxidase subunit 2
MSLFSLLLADDVGILSLITIVVATLVVVVCAVIFIHKAREASNHSPTGRH